MLGEYTQCILNTNVECEGLPSVPGVGEKFVLQPHVAKVRLIHISHTLTPCAYENNRKSPVCQRLTQWDARLVTETH